MNLYVLYKAPWHLDNLTELAIYKLVHRKELVWEFVGNASSQLIKEMGGYHTFPLIKFKPEKLKIDNNYCNWGGNLVHVYSLRFNPSQIQ